MVTMRNDKGSGDCGQKGVSENTGTDCVNLFADSPGGCGDPAWYSLPGTKSNHDRGSVMLEKNQVAPEFCVPNQDNEPVKLSDYKGSRNVVLYFYPKDDTPGCTVEANQFTGLAGEFAELETVVIGVSKDSCSSHQAFIDKYGLRVDLLADTSGELCERYGVWQEKEKNGVKKMGIVRSTFLVNKEGVLEEVLYGVAADGHAGEILGKIRSL